METNTTQNALTTDHMKWFTGTYSLTSSNPKLTESAFLQITSQGLLGQPFNLYSIIISLDGVKSEEYIIAPADIDSQKNRIIIGEIGAIELFVSQHGFGQTNFKGELNIKSEPSIISGTSYNRPVPLDVFIGNYKNRFHTTTVVLRKSKNPQVHPLTIQVDLGGGLQTIDYIKTIYDPSMFIVKFEGSPKNSNEVHPYLLLFGSAGISGLGCELIQLSAVEVGLIKSSQLLWTIPPTKSKSEK